MVGGMDSPHTNGIMRPSPHQSKRTIGHSVQVRIAWSRFPLKAGMTDWVASEIDMHRVFGAGPNCVV